MNFRAVIGLEIHVEMKTKSKMFSSAPVTFGHKPNSAVAPMDLALPGSMPLVNKQAVINGIRVAKALHMDIDNELWFDRKNYFYSDLAKGYQITQYRRPLGKNGYLDIEGKRIGFERLHLEEDTCKQVHLSNKTLLDYNRSGIPLLEINTLPDITNGDEAVKVVEKIRSMVSFLDVSDGKMEEGSLRVDVNISLMPIGSKKYGTRVEIKNLNTLSNIKRALDYEVSRQEALLLSGGIVKAETRRFDESKKTTVPMRIKISSIDYKYFTEPNILPIKLSNVFIQAAINSSPELAEQKYQRYLGLGLSEYNAKLLTSNKMMCEYFERCLLYDTNPKSAANWILGDIQSILNKEKIKIDQFKIQPERLSQLLKVVDDSVISNKQARDVFKEMLRTDLSANEIIKKMNLSLVSDEKELINLIKMIIKDNPQLIIDYNNGKDKSAAFVIGQVMKLTNGKANPKITNELVHKELRGN